MPDVSSLNNIATRLVELLPGLTVKGKVLHLQDQTMSLFFDPRCGGMIERAWPLVWSLCEECGCRAHFEWETVLTTRTVLDTASAAPDYQAVNEQTVMLLVSREQEGEVAA
jgi:hypothetical protein